MGCSRLAASGILPGTPLNKAKIGRQNERYDSNGYRYNYANPVSKDDFVVPITQTAEFIGVQRDGRTGKYAPVAFAVILKAARDFCRPVITSRAWSTYPSVEAWHSAVEFFDPEFPDDLEFWCAVAGLDAGELRDAVLGMPLEQLWDKVGARIERERFAHRRVA